MRTLKFNSRPRIVAGVAASLAVLVGAGVAASPARADFTSERGEEISRAEVLERAQYWLDHQPGPYNQGATSPGPGDGYNYRRDCSGYVSMAWHLNANPSTEGIPNYAPSISKADLKPGDVLNSYSEHVLLFKSWANKEHTRINYYTFGSTPVKMRTNVPLYSGNIDSHPASNYVARRYSKIKDDVPETPVQRSTADVTGDGFADLVTTTSDGKLWMYANNYVRDDGQPYSAGTQIGNGWGSFTSVFGADVTGDGYRDLVGIKTDGTLWLYPNNIERDNGVPYSSADARQIGTSWNIFSKVFGADVTGDGYTDLVGIKPDGTMFLYANNIERDNGVPYSAATQIGSGWGGFTQVVGADLTGDGYTDLVAAKADGSLMLYSNNIERDGKPYSSTSVTQIGSGWNAFNRIIAADFSGDGVSDLVTTKPDGTLWLYPNNIGRDGVYFSSATARQDGSGWNPYSNIS
ncbi:hypothetical protein GCM10010112_59760 [Actinoplanes lobatus]|uniref:Tachylectin 2 domain-containing protein n=1 Tax=Actinoplanes lobatus TaxID=113568 RepID=A0A7W7MMC1_9ACTN|nr:VCBS repeat-containing protein [Actinoplanes lobatus]MBB4755040.1 hypothetical protein [Actinoplanes lobatus]GGN82387.1 hypothetical protein GCM10010112_59760 [Actinoplanes lobatus]GIE40642.1 hypothetical protein Alo02nite_35400 [Actinoplanes lobatus]